MASDDWKPDYVELRMLGHAAQKGFQAGSLLGTAIGAPLVAWREGGVTPERVFRGAAYGAIGGFGLSGAPGRTCAVPRGGGSSGRAGRGEGQWRSAASMPHKSKKHATTTN